MFEVVYDNKTPPASRACTFWRLLAGKSSPPGSQVALREVFIMATRVYFYETCVRFFFRERRVRSGEYVSDLDLLLLYKGFLCLNH